MEERFLNEDMYSISSEPKFGRNYEEYDEDCAKCGRMGCTGGFMCSKREFLDKELLDDVKSMCVNHD